MKINPLQKLPTILDVHILCLVHISMTFEPTGDTCTLLLVGMVCAFGTISHVQQDVKRMAKCTLREFQEVSEISNTSLNVRIWSFFASQPLLLHIRRCFHGLHTAVLHS